MILQKNIPASEQTVFLERRMNHADKKFSMGDLPEEFLLEMNEFIERNVIVAMSDGSFECCDSCLKAHALIMADVLELNDKEKKIIRESLKCNSGHNGYYLDDGNLIEIEEKN